MIRFLVPLLVLAPAPVLRAQELPLPDSTLAALASELSGEAAQRNLEFLAREHRMRGSRGFRRAADHILAQLQSYGIADARIEQFPADGRTYYGTQRSRPPWDAEFAELWELRREGDRWVRHLRLASWETMPVTLAQDSESGEAVSELVDVGEGTAEADYAGKDVRGKLVLAGAQPGAVAALAITRFGAAGILSYAQNQRTAWWGENENLVRWGHLGSFEARGTFAFMLSLQQARQLRQRLARGETIRLEARVRAGQHPGFYDIVTATIPGSDPARRDQEIVFSCHLDHQRPGANDNASGCVTILEVARALSRLIADRRIAPPARTLRFVWPPEIEGTLTLLVARPELASRIKAAIHLDMVGGGPETGATLHVTRGPGSLPSFVSDLGAAFGALVNRESDRFAATGAARFPLVSREGGKQAFRAEFPEFTTGSDHQIYAEGSFRIPVIYLNDWPDRYIHTNLDAPANIDPTKLLRAAFIAGASGLALAGLGPEHAGVMARLTRAAALRRAAVLSERMAQLPPVEAGNLARFHFRVEREVIGSLAGVGALTEPVRREALEYVAGLERLAGAPAPVPPDRTPPIYRRTSLRGPMSVFGFDYLEHHYGPEQTARLGLLRYQGLRGGGAEYAYEALNLVNGTRSVGEIRDALAAIYGPVPLELVTGYLAALASIGVIEVRP